MTSSRPSRPDRPLLAAAFLAALAAAACTSVYDEEAPGPPVYELRAFEARSPHGMVAAGTASAAAVGAEVLERGGNAVDAAVATAFALAVVDPGDSGLGGITLALVRLADGRAVAIDGDSRTPAEFDVERIIELEEAKAGVGTIEWSAVPTSMAVLAHMSRQYGSLPLGELLEPAIGLAEAGFTPSWFQVSAIYRNLEGIRGDPYLSGMVLAAGVDLPEPGQRFFRPDLGRTLRLIRDRGPQEFRFGSIAQAFDEDMRRRGGWVTRADLAAVRAREQQPNATDYRGYEVLAFPSPGSGACVVEAMNMLETFPVELLRSDSVDRLQVLTDVFRIVLADQQSMVPDPNEIQIFRDRGFERKEFSGERARRIKVGEKLADEDSPPVTRSCRDTDPDAPQTTHIAVIDRWGNTVSMTQSLGNFYGCRAAVPGYGILHNNLLGGTCPQGPRWAFVSDMAPTILSKDGAPFLALGSAGSARIPTVVALVASNVIDRAMSLQDAIAAPRPLWRGTTDHGVMLEVLPPITGREVDQLIALGHAEPWLIRFPTKINGVVTTGAVNAVLRDPATGDLVGVGDPRRNAHAVGAAR